jgi:hypothetical protein
MRDSIHCTHQRGRAPPPLDWPDTARAWWAADGAWGACGRRKRKRESEREREGVREGERAREREREREGGGEREGARE